MEQFEELEKQAYIERAMRDAYDLGYSAGFADVRNKNIYAYNPSSVWALAHNLFYKLFH